MKTLLSPLRYPGGKRRLVKYVQETLTRNGDRPKIFVEPFAGGASVSLQLLANDSVETIGLGERDPMLADFWRTVFFDSDWLIGKIKNIDISVSEWDRFRKMTPRSRRGNALKCLFLNRTSFSGILASSAGPIGGKSQTSDYPIDCRFPVDKIVDRIQNIANYADRVSFINNGDWAETIELARRKAVKASNVTYYFDPPFFNKANKLYRCFFSHDDHYTLFRTLMSLKSKWILSYDMTDEVVDLYSSHHNGHTIEIRYTAGSKSVSHTEELLATNFPLSPSTKRLWPLSDQLDLSTN